MKTFRKLQKVAIVVGMVYGLWLGCNEAATAISDSHFLKFSECFHLIRVFML